MTHDNDTIRRIVAETDRNLEALETLGRQLNDMNLLIAIRRFKEARFWLKEAGHGSHFDTPKGE